MGASEVRAVLHLLRRVASLCRSGKDWDALEILPRGVGELGTSIKSIIVEGTGKGLGPYLVPSRY